MSLNQTPTDKGKTQTPRSSSLPVYILLVFLAAGCINLVAFKLFWNSPTHDLVIDIQKASEESLDNPLSLPVVNSEVDTTDGVLKSVELDLIREQIDDLAGGLDAGQDFQPVDPEILRILEF